MTNFNKSILSLAGLSLLTAGLILGSINIGYQQANQTITDTRIYDSSFLLEPYCEMCDCRCERVEHIVLTCERREVPTEHEYIYICPQCEEVYRVKFSR